ncbi:uncharacterized protein LOC130678141 [Microplitis mediator]|uniref:uncharacterized protein LOC130678141 n=1 Tax=Microplitis mediator TaxID=375433 RepID=UPI00255736E0|nr:uncharacterized protein LOC130678141 [Microplitis mediator]
MKNIKKVALITLIVEIIVIVLCISLNVLKSPSDAKLERIKRCLIDKLINPEDEQKAADYIGHLQDSFQAKFMETVTFEDSTETIVRPKTGELSDFGIALLSMYQLDNKKTDCLTIVEYLIIKMDGKLGNLISIKNVPPWRDNWYSFSVSFTRMLAMYEYIGKNKLIKDICHRRIVEITPKLNQSLGSTHEHVNFVYIAIPRLLTNYLYNHPRFEEEVKSNLFSELDKEMQTHFNSSNDVKNGIYEDYSCICHHNIPSFSYITTLGDFYINTYRALGFKSTIGSSIMKILDKVIHPKLDFIPYGLFSREPKIGCTGILKRFWPNYERNPNYDVNIFPFIGLGVFKSEKFVFSVRVQREGIAAYEFDKWNQKFALGWIQMRKLYLTEVDYSSYNNRIQWEQLQVQPGVISFAKNNDNKFTAFTDKARTYTLPKSCENIKSYIGHLSNHKNKKLLYWSNKYEFHAFYGPKVEIFEIGVCTDNGLVMRYEIKNESRKDLKLILNDKDIHYGTDGIHLKASPNDPGTGIRISSGAAPVNWSQLFDETIEPKTVNWNNANNSMSFTFEGDSYSIEKHDNYHIVKCNDKIILAGNSSSLRNGSITHRDKTTNKNIIFKRDPDTLMYLPEQS